MTQNKKKALDLKIFPALIPTIAAVSVSLIVLGKEIYLLSIALLAGYFTFLIITLLIELIRTLRHRNQRRNIK
tara:strand:- start:337 stop:555 length:219 start_codon:yes stop_codon:yes gene_type:complete